MNRCVAHAASGPFVCNRVDGIFIADTLVALCGIAGNRDHPASLWLHSGVLGHLLVLYVYLMRLVQSISSVLLQRYAIRHLQTLASFIAGNIILGLHERMLHDLLLQVYLRLGGVFVIDQEVLDVPSLLLLANAGRLSVIQDNELIRDFDRFGHDVHHLLRSRRYFLQVNPLPKWRRRSGKHLLALSFSAI